MKDDDEEIRAVVEKQVSECGTSEQDQGSSAAALVSVAPAKEVTPATDTVRIPFGNYRRWGAPFIL
jgi:hypothetical protein